MIRRHATGFRLLLMAADAALATVLFVGLSFVRWGPEWLGVWTDLFPQTAAALALYVVAWLVCLTFYGLYRPRARWSLRGEASDVLKATGVLAVATLSVLFWFKVPDVSRLFLIALFPSQALLTIATRGLLRLALIRVRRFGRNTRFVLLLGSDRRAVEFGRKLEDHQELGLRVVGVLDTNDAPYGRGPWPWLGTIEDLERVLHERVVDEVAICLPFSRWEEIFALAHLCEEEGKIVRIPMQIPDLAVSVSRIEELDGTPVFSLVSGPDRALALAAKRVFDVVVGSAALLLLSPALLAISFALVLDTGRPILFRQSRVGLHGRLFEMWKFRSMTRDAESRQTELAGQNEVRGNAFKLARDPRVTRVGRLLRRTSLDELPQLLNVIRGEMSLVGPRPPLEGEVDGYDLWHRRRLSMKPGLTGLWQVRSRRHPDFDRWVEDDLEYIDRWSLWLDLKILARTIPAALEGR